jgi:hypothetical protein
MNNHNEQFVESSDLEKILDTKIVLTSSYQALVADLQTQNQQLTEKLIVAMEENTKLRDQLQQSTGQFYSDKAYAEFERANPSKGIKLPNLQGGVSTLIAGLTTETQTLNTIEDWKGYASPF